MDSNARGLANTIASTTQELANTIVRTGNFVVGEVGAVAYVVGYFMAFGMNWAHKDTSALGAIFMSLLSWINVGYLAALR